MFLIVINLVWFVFIVDCFLCLENFCGVGSDSKRWVVLLSKFKNSLKCYVVIYDCRK